MSRYWIPSQKQTKAKILVESTVAGQISTTLTDVSLETALTAISKTSGKMEWRKLYLAADSDLIKQPDRLASTVRLMSGFSFPSLVVAGSSTGKIAAHFDDKKESRRPKMPPRKPSEW